MKQLYYLQSLVLFCLLFSACSKDSPEPEEPYLGSGYIRGNFGSEYLNFTIYLGGDSSANYYDPHINGGQLYLRREAKHPDERVWWLSITGIDLNNMPIPSEFSSSQPYRENQGSPTYGNFGIDDYSKPQQITWGGPEDTYNYVGGTTFEDAIIRVTSKKNDIVKGTFEGKVRTASGSVREVKKGEFMIKIIRLE